MNIDPKIEMAPDDQGSVTPQKSLKMSILQPINSYWTWWTQELSALVPSVFRDIGAAAKIDLKMGDDGVSMGNIRQNKLVPISEETELSKLSTEQWEEIRTRSTNRSTRLFLPAKNLLEIHIELPQNAGSSVRQFAGLQMPVLSPLDPHLLYWDAKIDRKKPAPKGKVAAVIIAARKDAVENIEGIFADNDLMPPTFCALIHGQVVELKKPIRINDESKSKRSFAMPLLASLLLISIPISTVFLSEQKRTTTDIETQQLENQIAPKIAAMKETRKIALRQKLLAPINYHPAITPLFDDIAAQLDADSMIISAQHSGAGPVIIDIETSNPDAVKAALSLMPNYQIRGFRQSPATANARPTIQVEVAAK